MVKNFDSYVSLSNFFLADINLEIRESSTTVRFSDCASDSEHINRENDNISRLNILKLNIEQMNKKRNYYPHDLAIN